MWSAYLTAKLLFLLLLVDASLGQYIDNSCLCEAADIDWYPDGNVAIRWDIMNKTRTSYSANVTIFNYLTNYDIEGLWELSWEWLQDEVLLSTVGAKGTQHRNVSVGDNDYCWNKVIIVDILPQTDNRIVPNCCKGGVIPSWFREADLSKSSSSFQIDVGRADMEFYPHPTFVTLTTPKSEYICDTVEEVTNTPGYQNTWTTECGPSGL